MCCSGQESRATDKCAVVGKIPVRPTKNGSMFTLNLCDGDSSSTMLTACLNKEMCDEFEPNKTYDFDQFKLKKGYGARCSLTALSRCRLTASPR